jgi:hypothetical protein
VIPKPRKSSSPYFRHCLRRAIAGGQMGSCVKSEYACFSRLPEQTSARHRSALINDVLSTLDAPQRGHCHEFDSSQGVVDQPRTNLWHVLEANVSNGSRPIASGASIPVDSRNQLV